MQKQNIQVDATQGFNNLGIALFEDAYRKAVATGVEPNIAELFQEFVAQYPLADWEWLVLLDQAGSLLAKRV